MKNGRINSYKSSHCIWIDQHVPSVWKIEYMKIVFVTNDDLSLIILLNYIPLDQRFVFALSFVPAVELTFNPSGNLVRLNVMFDPKPPLWRI